MNVRQIVLVALVCVFLLNVGSNSVLYAEANPVVDGTGPYIDDIYFNVISNDDQQVLALIDDNIDVIGDMIDPVFLDVLMSSQNIAIETTHRNGYGLYTLNCQKYPLNISSFRRAIAFALDKERISDELWDGFSTPQDAVLPSINQFSIEDQLSFHYYTADVAKGHQLLDAAGFLDVDTDGFREAPDGSDFQIVVTSAQESSIAIGAGEIMTEALQNLGIDVIFEPSEFWEYFNEVQNHGDFDIVFFGNTYSDYSIQWLATAYGSEYADIPGFNYPMFENATYDSWINQLLHSGDYEAVYDAAIEMQRILAYECPTIIAYNNLFISAYRTDKFEGFVNDFSEGAHGWWTNQKVHLLESQGGPYGGTLRWSLPQDISTSNVLTCTNVYDSYIFEALYDSLLKVDPNGFFIPWLAESHYVENHWDNPNVPDGHTRITFNIVQNATWSDGLPLTAQDVAFTFNYIFDHNLPAAEYYGNDLFAAYAPTDYQFVIEFLGESYWFLDSIGSVPIIPKHQFAYQDPYTLNLDYSDLITSGPFLYDDRVYGEYFHLVYNPTYFKQPDRGLGEPEGLPTSIPAPSLQVDAVQNGVDEWIEYLETTSLEVERIDSLVEDFISSETVPEGVVTDSRGLMNVLLYTTPDVEFGEIAQFCNMKWTMDLGVAYLVHASVNSADDARFLSKNPDLLYLAADRIYTERGTTDSIVSKSTSMTQIRDIVGVNGPSAVAYDGSGTLVGMVDSGTDFSIPDMQDAMAVDGSGYPLSYDPTGWGMQLMVRANSSYIADIEAWLNDGNVLTYENNGKYYLDVSTWDPVLNNNGGTRNLLGLLPPYGDGYPEGSVTGFIGIYEWAWGIPSFSEFVATEMWKDWEIPAPTGVDYRVGWVFEQRQDRYAKVFAPALIMDNNQLIIDWNGSAAWTQMWNWAAYDESIDLSAPEDRAMISNQMDWSFTDDALDGYIYTVDGNNILAADRDNDGTDDWGLGSFTWVYDDPGFFGDEQLFCGMRTDGMAFALMYPSDNNHGQLTSTAVGSRGVSTYDIYGNGSYVQLPGVATGTDLISVKGVTSGSDLGAMFWAAGFHLNESSGFWEYTGEHKADIVSNSWIYDSGTHLDLTYLSMTWDLISVPGFVDAANPGTLFLVSSGNYGGDYMTSGPPATSGAVVSVGATTSIHRNDGYDVAAQSTTFSSNGPSFVGLSKPDILAPGIGVNPAAFQNTLLGDLDYYWWQGTSLSCPVAAGAAAVILEAMRTNGFSDDSVTLKEILLSSAQDLGYDGFIQGHGLVDVEAAVSAIESGSSNIYYFDNTDSYDYYADAMDDAWSTWMFFDGYGIDQGAPTHPRGLGTSTVFFGNMYPGDSRTVTLNAYGYDGLTYGLSAFDSFTANEHRSYAPIGADFRSYFYTVGDVAYPGFYNLTEELDPGVLSDFYDSEYTRVGILYGTDYIGFRSEIVDWIDLDGNGVVNDYVDESNFGDTIRRLGYDDHHSNGHCMRLSSTSGIGDLFEGTPTLIVYDPRLDHDGIDNPIWLGLQFYETTTDDRISISPGVGDEIDIVLDLPVNAESGIHQGFLEVYDSTSGYSHRIPYSYMVICNTTASEAEIQTIVEPKSVPWAPYESSQLIHNYNYWTNAKADAGGSRNFLIEVSNSSAEVLVFRVEWENQLSKVDMYLRSTSYNLLAQTNDGYYPDDNPFTFLFDPTTTEDLQNTLIYAPGGSVAGKYYLTISPHFVNGAFLPENINASIQWFPAIPTPTPSLTYSTNWDTNQYAVNSYSSLVGDHVTLNGSWTEDYVENFPEYAIDKTTLRLGSGVYFEETHVVLIPEYWDDPFDGAPIHTNLFDWMFVSGIRAGDTVNMEVIFTNDDCDIFVYWADTDPATWTYPSVLTGDQLITGANPERGSFVAERDGTLAVGCFDYSQDSGTWTLIVDTREFDSFDECGSEIIFDTIFFDKNVTRDLTLSGRNLAGLSFESQWFEVSICNYFRPTVEVISPNGGETWTGSNTISWSATATNVDADFRHSVYISSDHGSTFQLYARFLTADSYDWDTSVWQSMDSYMVRIVTDDRGVLGEDVSDGTFAAGEIPVLDDENPLIEGDASYSYIEIFTGNQLSWTVFDLHPDYVSLYVDNVLTETVDWTTKLMGYHVVCDGLAPGLYNYTVLAVDQANNSESYTTWLNVEPDPAPVITGPDDFSYPYGDLNYREIRWFIDDYNIDHVTVYLDGVVFTDEDYYWDNYTIDASGLDVGEHNFTIEVTDSLLHSSADTVMLRVVETVVIHGESDFVNLGFPGSGTQEDPYVIDGLSFEHDGVCIEIRYVDAYFVIQNCNFSSYTGIAGCGIYLIFTSHGTVRDCNFEGLLGILLSSSYDCTITECNFASEWQGVVSYYSTSLNFTANTFNGCGIRFNGDTYEYLNHTLNSNTVNEKPIGYFRDLSIITIDDSSYGQLIFLNCSSVTITSGSYYDTTIAITIAFADEAFIEDLEIIDCAFGILVYNTPNCNIRGVTVYRTIGVGIGLYNSPYSIVEDSSLIDCDSGLNFHQSPDSVIRNNTITGSTGAGIGIGYSPRSSIIDNTVSDGNNLGIYVWNSEYSNITGNSIDRNHYKGLWLTDSDHCIITGNSATQNSEPGIWVENCNNVTIRDCIALGNSWHGFFILGSSNITLMNDTASNSDQGFYFEYSTDCKVISCYSTSCIYSGIRVWESDSIDIVNSTFSNSYGDGICLDAAIDILIDNCSIFENGWIGIHIYNSDWIEILDSYCYSNLDTGIAISSSSNIAISNSIIENNDAFGIIIDWVINCSITDTNSWLNRYECLGIWQSHNVTIMNCNFNDSLWTIVTISGSTDVIIDTCVIHDGFEYGIGIWSSSYVTINNTQVSDTNLCAIVLDDSHYTSIINCALNRSGEAGLGIVWATFIHVENNVASYNAWEGIALWYASYSTVIRNIVENNWGGGLTCDENAHDNVLYDNHVGWNGGWSALDHGWNNQWDNGVDLGNYWSDYSGTGYYYTDGIAASYDRYPDRWVDSVNPVVSSPSDIVYDEGESGFSIAWTLSDAHPGSYIVELEGEVIRYFKWHYPEISIHFDVDNHAMGEWNYTIIVYDGAGNCVIDTVIVSVLDGNPPSVDGPADFNYSRGSTGNTISWSATDSHPSSYQILLDGLEIDSGAWTLTTEVFGINIDGLEVGIYNYTIVVTDVGGNIDKHTVLVTVIDDSLPVVNHPSDITYEHGESGYSIIWAPADLDPVSYEVWFEDALLYSGEWNASGELIAVNVDGLTPGIYNFTLIVTDVGLNSVVDTVLVTVTPDVTPPVVTTPVDQTYAEGSVGHSITWNPSDLLPSSYAIYLDEVLWKSGDWNDTAEVITISIDGLAVGDHNFTIVVSDIGSNDVSDYVQVTVYDGTAPTIDNPPDIEYNETDTGYSITWIPVDVNPTTYEIRLDGLVVDSGAWTGGSINIDIDGHPPGYYSYELTVFDVGSNSKSDSVIVTVVDNITPTIDAPADIEYEEETLGHSITWTPYDLHPGSYTLYRNGTEIDSGFWTCTSLIFSVDRLSPALYLYLLEVFDESGNSVTDLVNVNVIEAPSDEEPPLLNHPIDIEYEEEMTGFSITWNPADANPQSYEILRNGTTLDSRSWSGESISISVDGLSPSLYNYTVVVHDSFGNWATDLVWVNVTAKFIDIVDPIIDSPADIEYEEESTGYSIVWAPRDDYPVSYNIYKDNSVVKSGPWAGGDISIGVDGLSPGTYNYTIIVFDEGNNNATDLVWVTVTEKFVDNEAPIIDNPEDVEYEEEMTGYSIIWTPYDLYPGSYEIYSNDTNIESGSWDGSSITIGVDGLISNLYNYTIVVFDESGNSVSDMVWVNVTEKFVDLINPLVDSPPDIEYEEESLGNTILWTPTDAYPDSYRILRDGAVIESGVWDGSQIGIDIDGLSPGVYVYRLVVYDIGENSASNTVVVTVTEKFVDTIAPTIDSPSDIEYEEEQVGYSILWSPMDDYPQSYELYRDEMLLESGPWAGGSIEIGIDGLSPAVYNYTLIVFDIGDNIAVDTVFVTVTEKIVDLTPPSLSSPSDIAYEATATGYSISWTATDDYPSNYVIYRNDISVKSGSWTVNPIAIGVDGLSEGVYNFTIIVFDDSGNFAIDVVWVTVEPNLVPTINDLEGTVYEFGETGNYLTWVPTDDHPAFYSICRDGVLIKNQAWYGLFVRISVDGLSEGTYNYLIEVYDEAGNSVSDEAYVTVTPKIVDWTAPTVNDVHDFACEAGMTGAYITWAPRDLHPYSYRILREGMVIRSGSWTGGDIKVGLNALTPGVYNYTIHVIDEYGNYAVDTVIVTVNDIAVDITAPYIGHQENVTYLVNTYGHVLSWIVYDVNNESYTIKRNGVILRSGVWTDSPISISIDMLAPDIYEYTLTVRDSAGHESSDLTYVIVQPEGWTPEGQDDPPDPLPDSPIIDSPEDVTYEQNSSGHRIEWNPMALYPYVYAIYRDGVIIEAGPWTGEDISIDIDGLDPGVYSFLLEVRSTEGQTDDDEVIVTVLTAQVPSIQNNGNLTFEYGMTGQTVSWDVYDAFPHLFVIFRDGVVLDSGTWTSGELSIDVDELDVGFYMFELLVYDQSDLMNSDLLFVTVASATAPSIDHPADVEYDEGVGGNTITWSPTDSYPESYFIYRDGTLLESGSWLGLPVIAIIDGLASGIYSFTIEVYDQAGNMASDEIIVTVNEVIIDPEPPAISSPDDLNFEEGTSGLDVTWITYDANPTFYRIELNGVLVEAGTWDGSDFTISCDSFAPGTYELVLTLFDINNNFAFDSVMITVSTSIAPVLDSPNDVTYEEDMTGMNITWHPEDLYPKSYSITRDGTVVKTGLWTGASIGVSVEGLVVGSYTYVITICDAAGNSGTDSVLVWVLEPSPPLVTQPSDIQYEDGFTRASISWSATELYPANYEIRRDGTLVRSGVWSGGIVSKSIDGLTPGIYSYIITFYDKGGHVATDEVLVTVLVATPPSVTGPSSIEYEYGSTGYSIEWTCSDLFPSTFTIKRNDTVLQSGQWTSTTIDIDVDALVPGYYAYSLTVRDLAGHQTTHIVVVRVYISEAPSIVGPEDLTYEEGSSGHSLTWQVNDLFPSSYIIKRNGIILESGTWVDGVITLDVDNLLGGSYLYELSLIDLADNLSTDSVIVSVLVGTDPIIDSPSDISYTAGETGFEILWTPFDEYPNSYSIFRNETLIESGAWNGDPISIGIDGLVPAIHIYTINVFDRSGNVVEDQVIVTVQEAEFAELILVVTSVSEFVSSGDNVVYTISWMNMNSVDTYDVELVLSISSLLEFVGSSVSFISNGTHLIYSIGVVPGDIITDIDVTLQVNLMATNDTDLWLNATLVYYDASLLQYESYDGHVVTVLEEVPTEDLHTAAWWKNQFCRLLRGKSTAYSFEHMQSLVELVATSSEFFSDVVTPSNALDVLLMNWREGLAGLAERQLYALWLNLANDAITAGTEIDLVWLTDSTTVGEVIVECEAIVQDSEASNADLIRANLMCLFINMGWY